MHQQLCRLQLWLLRLRPMLPAAVVMPRTLQPSQLNSSKQSAHSSSTLSSSGARVLLGLLQQMPGLSRAAGHCWT
jgi:hypothetical protein